MQKRVRYVRYVLRRRYGNGLISTKACVHQPVGTGTKAAYWLSTTHNISFFVFGLTRNDSADVHKKKTNTQTPPTQAVIRRNKRRIRSLYEDIDNGIVAAQDEDDNDSEDVRT